MSLKRWIRINRFDSLVARVQYLNPYGGKIKALLNQYPLIISPSKLKNLLRDGRPELQEGIIYIGRKEVRDRDEYKIFYVTGEESERDNTLYVEVRPDRYTEGAMWKVSKIQTIGNSKNMYFVRGGKYEAWMPLEELYNSSSHFINWLNDNPLDIKV